MPWAVLETLQGDPSKARAKLGWRPTVSFDEMIRRMVREDLREAEKDVFCEKQGFKTLRNLE